MNDMTIFNYNGKAQVRTIIDEKGEPWFVAKDVCDILEIVNVAKAARGLATDEVSSITLSHGTSSKGGSPIRLIINKPGLYRLIMRSDKPEARKFQYWVTHEVLPQIDKTGSYIPTNSKMVMIPNFDDPVVAALAWVEAKREAIAFEEKAQVAETKVIEMKPKAGFFDKVMDSGDLYAVEVAAKMLKKEWEDAGFHMWKMGRNNLFRVQ